MFFGCLLLDLTSKDDPLTTIRSQHDIEQPYDLFGTLRFSRFGKTDPTFVLTPDRVERAFWFRGEAVVLAATVHDTRSRSQPPARTPHY
jgi:hypothetical protein